MSFTNVGPPPECRLGNNVQTIAIILLNAADD